MHAARILTLATIIEICVGCGLWAVLGVGGASSGWLDMFNCIVPAMAVTGLAAAAAARAALPKGRTRVVCIGMALAGAAYAGGMCAEEAIGRWPPPRTQAAGKPYRVVIANVFRNNDRPFRAAISVLEQGGDAVIISEADGKIVRAQQLFDTRYPYATDCPESGVRIWLKTPILAQGCGLPLPPGAYESWGKDFVWVRTLGPDANPIVLAGVHLGRPYPPERQATEKQGLAVALAPLARERLILGGDFNVAPWSFAMIQLERSLRPLHRFTGEVATYPGILNVTHTVWSWPLLPIDHIFAGPRWSVLSQRRFRIPGSDHFGLEIQAVLAP
jgi:endonuclease/exonuclease/phosphatase (EEP) superfamily protein YafD